MNQNGFSYRLTLFATVLALVVVVLGAYTRLADAGLGCPDWPGCYGHYTVPTTQKTLQKAAAAYPNQPVEAAKAWAEMIHRYVAGTLGLLILTLFITAIRKRKTTQHPIATSTALVALLLFQAALGMWTVTWKLLPLVVMGHLLGGLTILSVLWWTHLSLSHRLPSADLTALKPWAIAGLVMLALQLALGGWTSSNYAALSCPDFPYCQGSLWPVTDFKTAFDVTNPIGPDYQGGLLNTTARNTIHVMHRLGALITALYWLVFSFVLIFTGKTKRIQSLGAMTLFILLFQVILGVLNVTEMLPLPIAVMHNGVAALLLLTIVTLNFVVNKPCQPQQA